MSYPPTEADVISNDSLFSDSVQFDAAEKPITPGDAYGAVDATAYHNDRGLPVDPAEDDLPPPPPPVEEVAAPPPTNAFMKPRRMATKQPKRWVPVDLKVPKNDPDDEFDIGTAQKPIYRETGEAPPKVDFRNGEPDLNGEVTNCFEEPGLLYRIVDKKNKTWAFYNDSRAFEVHVTCTFGKHSKIQPLDKASMKRDESTGEYVVEVTVYPSETELFVKGFVNGFTSKLRAMPLSDDYYVDRSKSQAESIVQVEMDAIRALAGDETDAEAILQICLQHDLPFVDLSFPPVQSSIDSGASKAFKQLPWGRPRMYVSPELHSQIRLFRDGISPGDVEQGELGDCWLMCAVATMAESPDVVMQMFRHPKGAESGRRERAIGAYRVSFNKNGLWRSILVDDYLPVVAGKPKFAHSKDPCELWPAILEKAFAKMHRSYAMIQSGDPMHALTDMTGFPAMRIDDIFAEGTVNGGRELFDNLAKWQEAGYRTVITTPGKAPAIMPDSNNTPDFSEEPELEEALAGTGLLPGHAYTILDVKDLQQGRVRLVCIRSPWTYGSGWTGRWAWGSPEWEKYTDVATACNVAKHKDDRSITWMALEDMLKFFNGGGVLFCSSTAYDARVPLTFADCKPSVVFQLQVSAPLDAMFIMSNMDHRGMHADEDGAADADPNNMEYPPVMLSLAMPVDGQTDVYTVVKNTSADATEASDSRWTFLQAREIAMICHLEPSPIPYLLIPRLMEDESTIAGGESGENFEEVVHPVHFINNYEHAYPEEANSGAKEVPVTIGVQTATALGSSLTVTSCRISGVNAVFENFPKFPADDVEPQDDLYYQIKLPGCGYAQEKTGSVLY